MTLHSLFLQEAIKACQISKSIHQYYRKKGFTTSSKTGVYDIVTSADKESEKTVKKYLLDKFPTHSFLGEETGLNTQKPSEYKWILDPVDGTLNFSRDFPFYCTSLALQHKNKLIVAVILDSNLEELFFAVEGKGAYLNGKKLKVSNVNRLGKSLLSTGFPSRPEEIKMNISYLDAVLEKGIAIRRAGSAALDLAYVAAGRLDGFWELLLKPWDTAAGVLLIKEAGGKISTIEDDPYDFTKKSIVATNVHIHDELLGLLSTHLDK